MLLSVTIPPCNTTHSHTRAENALTGRTHCSAAGGGGGDGDAVTGALPSAAEPFRAGAMTAFSLTSWFSGTFGSLRSGGGAAEELTGVAPPAAGTGAPAATESDEASATLAAAELASGAPAATELATEAPAATELATGAPAATEPAKGAPAATELATGAPAATELGAGEAFSASAATEATGLSPATGVAGEAGVTVEPAADMLPEAEGSTEVARLAMTTKSQPQVIETVRACMAVTSEPQLASFSAQSVKYQKITVNTGCQDTGNEIHDLKI